MAVPCPVGRLAEDREWPFGRCASSWFWTDHRLDLRIGGMARVNQGRRGADIEGDFVVFLIGARLQAMHPIRSLRDLGGMRGMPYMLKYLTSHPDKGLLGYEGYGLTMTVQYWRSFEHLERFAHKRLTGG